MSNAVAAPAYRYLGLTDECVECQRCGKAELKATVVLGILDVDGNVEAVTYYGSTCAARALAVRGGGRKVLEYARAADRETREHAAEGRRILALYGAAEDGRFASRDTEREAMRTYVRRNSHAALDGGVRAQLADLMAHWAAKVAEGRRIGA